MQSQADNVTAYLEEVPEERRECLHALRALCLETLTGYEEGMAYGMPVYLRNGVAEVAWASQKGYIALYVMKKDVVDTHRHLLAGLSVGKGCIRYSKPAKLNLEVVRSLLTATRESPEAPC